MVKHFLDIADLSTGQLTGILNHADAVKQARKGLPQGMRDHDAPLSGRVLAMIFEKPSTRTRISFDVGMRQLGGETLLLSGSDLQIGRGESIHDTAKVLSRFVDAIMIRTFAHETLLELAEHSTVPVINGLTDATHPCQVMADVMTLREHKGPLDKLSLAYVGDSNNMTTSLVHGSAKFGFSMKIACPPELAPPAPVLSWGAANGAQVTVSHDPHQAVDGVDCVVTDTWLSMGDKDETNRHNLLKPYQVDERLMRSAKPDAVFMHCLPAHRGEEVTAGVIDGPQSVVFDEAENRMHVQKSILAWCLGAINE